jgi:hypothetical protein
MTQVKFSVCVGNVLRDYIQDIESTAFNKPDNLQQGYIKVGNSHEIICDIWKCKTARIRIPDKYLELISANVNVLGVLTFVSFF